MRDFVVVSIGAIFGANARYILSRFAAKMLGPVFPYGTLFVNILGCLVAGILAAVFTSRFTIRQDYQLALAVGFLGGFTTFSAFGLQSFELLSSGQIPKALFYVASSIVFGILAVFLGYGLLTRLIR